MEALLHWTWDWLGGQVWLRSAALSRLCMPSDTLHWLLRDWLRCWHLLHSSLSAMWLLLLLLLLLVVVVMVLLLLLWRQLLCRQLLCHRLSRQWRLRLRLHAVMALLHWMLNRLQWQNWLRGAALSRRRMTSNALHWLLRNRLHCWQLLHASLSAILLLLLLLCNRLSREWRLRLHLHLHATVTLLHWMLDWLGGQTWLRTVAVSRLGMRRNTLHWLLCDQLRRRHLLHTGLSAMLLLLLHVVLLLELGMRCIRQRCPAGRLAA